MKVKCICFHNFQADFEMEFIKKHCCNDTDVIFHGCLSVRISHVSYLFPQMGISIFINRLLWSYFAIISIN